MKIEDNIRLSKLFDAYGVLLSSAQQDIISQHLFDDLTGSEIAENKNISRQAVKDALKKAINKLEWYEEKLHFLEKADTYEREIEKLKEGK